MKKQPKDTLRKRVARHNYSIYVEYMPYYAHQQVLPVNKLVQNQMVLAFKGYEPTSYLLNQKRSFKHI